MNVLVISQCDKNALTESRRIIDQFAERRGDRVWQTAITQQGLDTLRRMLKKTARKNTAVACHWIHRKNHSELLWIVGSAVRFGERGAVPTNTTERKILRSEDEHTWRSVEKIRLLAAMAALWHDLGKACRAFQYKLTLNRAIADPVRHEWVSLRLFQAFVGDDDDSGWLGRLVDLPALPDLTWVKRRVVCDTSPADPTSPFKKLPALARIIGWLIVSHHRIPVRARGSDTPSERLLERLPKGIDAQWCGARLDSNDARAALSCWEFEHGLPFNSHAWRKRVRRYASRIKEHQTGILDAAFCAAPDPYALHISRLVLMLADHHYSSLSEGKRRAIGDASYPLIANTIRSTGEPNQRLDEHLIGVELATGRIVRQLPALARHLPRIARHRGFARRSSRKRFAWQDRAYDLAMALRQRSATRGFFGLNMASTGKGKTLANGRIMYALADPYLGARFTLALGLRILTLQTGEAYRSKLGLGPDDLAVLVGGARVRELYEHGMAEDARRDEETDAGGSESAQSLEEAGSYVHYEGSVTRGPLSEWLAMTRGATELLSAPILACTIDHLMPASESLRGGRQIAPMLRLMTSDLVLDEPDDFGLEDLPALARLVHWAGLLGTRVLLSSATLPPALVQGLFAAYLEGRRCFQSNHGDANEPVGPVVAWFDELDCQAGEHTDIESFAAEHQSWAKRRCAALANEPEQRRKAVIVDLPELESRDEADVAQLVATTVAEQIHDLHARHHSVDPVTKRRVSFGLVRMANIQPLIAVTRAIAKQGAQPGHRLHLVCYHSQHPLLVRSQIERRLDRLLSRHKPEALFDDGELRSLLSEHTEPDQIFVVIATPVAEVGRDHDYDWAVVEPSSMRSIIQLAGRVRRHREGSAKTSNLVLLDRNLRALRGESPAFCKPGFEARGFELSTHSLRELMTDEQIERIDSSARIVEREQPDEKSNLADLEHAHLRAVMLGDGQRRKLEASQWWTSHAHLSGELQRVQRFRNDPQGRQRFELRLDDDDTGDDSALRFVLIERNGTATAQDNLMEHVDLSEDRADSVGFVGGAEYREQVEALAGELDLDPIECARRYGIIDLPARGAEQGFYYNPALGFWRRD